MAYAGAAVGHAVAGLRNSEKPLVTLNTTGVELNERPRRAEEYSAKAEAHQSADSPDKNWDARAAELDKRAQLVAEAEARDDFRRQLFHIVAEAIALVVLIFGGVIFYMEYEDWDFVDALYFVTVTCTAVGYGDMYPTDDLGKIITVIYVTLGLLVLAASLGTWSSVIAERLQRAAAEKNHDEQHPPGFCKSPDRRRITTAVFFLVLFVAVGTMFYGGYDDGVDSFSYVDGLYLSVMTITTVGYGDISPQNSSMRLFTVFYILFGVALFANCIQVLVTVYVRNEIKRKQKRQLSKQITIAELRQFGGSDCKLDKCEFALAKLVAQGKITHKEIAQCYKQFKAMDVDHSGLIDMTDIQMMQDGITEEAHAPSIRQSAELRNKEIDSEITHMQQLHRQKKFASNDSTQDSSLRPDENDIIYNFPMA